MSRIETTHEKRDIRYSDFSTNFITNPITGNLARLVNDESVKESLKNRILTNKGERPYDASYGSNVKKRLFDLSSPETADNIKTDVEKCLNEEPRIKLHEVQVYDRSDNNGYQIIALFSLINIPEILSLDFILKRAR